MKPLAIFIFGLALASCPRPAGAQVAPDAGQPQFLLLGTNTVSLGKIHGCQAQRATFRFKNTSPTPASVLALRPTCPCVQGAADRMTTPPGGEMAVTLTLDPGAVHGEFLRGLWVTFDDPAQKRVLLNVAGEVVPLFAGAPAEPLAFQSLDTNVAWTNRLTLTASSAGYRLGAPQVATNAGLRVEAQLAPVAKDSGNASYDLTLTVIPLVLGRSRSSVTLPVEGDGSPLPVRVDVLARVGQALAVSPDQVVLYASETPVTRRLLLRTDAEAADAGALTWEPHVEGLAVQTRPTKRAANILVALQFSPAAVRELRARKDARLTFRYPNHAPATVRLVAAPGRATEPEEHETRP